ncbi:DNA resolvase [Bordetella genomosp. 10]|uniref:DNA resolvase n=1 Tax=Bordetella genomosp. 10 TaxID=1416804 RepID=A0A261SD73_9BORD|nr:recombinase family protein [Bordetella genomosp. 10]OZI34750.1 DNA resolvase [Bordetella genomosp. 10]
MQTMTGKTLGYARVSTEDQNLDLQIAALKRANCDRIYTDKGISGSTSSRPGLDALLRTLSPGSTLVVWRLDRLGRSLRYLVDLIDKLGRKNIQFVSLTENIDTSNSGGVLIFHMMAALAEFERALISERTRAGMAAAKARGRHVGRRRSLTPEQCIEALQALKSSSLENVAAAYSVHPRTLRRIASHEDCVSPPCQGEQGAALEAT